MPRQHDLHVLNFIASVCKGNKSWVICTTDSVYELQSTYTTTTNCQVKIYVPTKPAILPDAIKDNKKPIFHLLMQKSFPQQMATHEPKKNALRNNFDCFDFQWFSVFKWRTFIMSISDNLGKGFRLVCHFFTHQVQL